jgi:putative drug exporter of the RND superfamily
LELDVLRKVAGFCYSRRWLVLGAWVGVLLAIGMVGNRFGGDPADDFTMPTSESQRVFELLQDNFPQAGQDGIRVVFGSEAGVGDDAIRPRIEALLAELSAFDGVTTVASPFERFGQVSPDGAVAFSIVQLDVLPGSGFDLDRDLIRQIKGAVDEAAGDGLVAHLGGPGVRFVDQEPDFGNREMIGVIAAVIILLITFGSVIAMGLPLLTAAFGLGIGLSLVALFSHVLPVPIFAPQLALMIGLGVGIDYALFIVTRFRQALHGGLNPRESVVLAIDTSGRAVLFAGTVVVISLLGLFVIGINFVQGMAIAASTAVAVVMLASVTLLPAILGFAGHAIDRLHIPGIHRDESDHRSTIWFRWSRLVQRKPLPAGLAGVAFLVVLAIPLLSMEMGFTDEGNDPPDSTTRLAYDLLAEGFGPGFNGPLILVTELTGPDDLSRFGDVVAAVGESDGVVAVSPAFPAPDGSVAVATAFPSTGPQERATRDLIKHLRSEVIPSVEGPEVSLGGLTALFVDISDFLQSRLFYFIGAVLVLSFLLLLLVFRSIVIPIKAALVNLLGIGAAYGVIVAIFQWGWLSGLVGVERTGPIEPFLPMMLFAIVFGLSMDYEVFLLSRIREEYTRSRRNDIAVADGLAATARVITAAAAIMVTLFFSFALGDQREIKLFGIGLAMAILLDATVVRMVVVPSLMELMGNANWWFPKRLDQIIPRISIEAAPELLEAEVPASVEVGEDVLVGATPARSASAPKPKPLKKAAGRRKNAPRKKAPGAKKPAARKPAARSKATPRSKARAKGEPAARKASSHKPSAKRKPSGTARKPAARKPTAKRKPAAKR